MDLFAGPGGLGEGFSSYSSEDVRYSIPLSIEMEQTARSTLKLRKFFHEFRDSAVPSEYYEFLRQEISLEELYAKYSAEASQAENAAWMAELGKIEPDELDRRIRKAIPVGDPWVLIGGPPCQAYSVIGRSRVNGINPDDHRVFLYQEYLKILAEYEPSIFVMENVPGLLSANVNGHSIFDQIIADLSKPRDALARAGGHRYRVFSLVTNQTRKDMFGEIICNPKDFVVKMENYGIPQKRHRVILYGVREDFLPDDFPTLLEQPQVSTSDVISDLPRIRSGMTQEYDSKNSWVQAMTDMDIDLRKMYSQLSSILGADNTSFKAPQKDRGAQFISSPNKKAVQHKPEWYGDNHLQGVCNHESKGHMTGDLYRYYFAAKYALNNDVSPKLQDFPEELLPNHKNASPGKKNYAFADRFRVQLAKLPSTTITSHIAKDGHYYIHYDPTQCRSLTVREAARLQTFPDNYFFCGSRTDQYRQVGNAVPPMLAYQIAGITATILRQAKCNNE